MRVIVCDVDGCEQRAGDPNEVNDGFAPGFGPVASLPRGWRLITLHEELPPPRPPEPSGADVANLKAFEAIAAMVPPDMAEKFSDAIEAMRGLAIAPAPSLVAPVMRTRIAHVCPRHELPTLRDSAPAADQLS